MQQWRFDRIHMIGRVAFDSHTLGDGSIFHKSLFFAVYPHDIKGLGTFTIRHVAPQLDETWVYIRTVRRVRRLSGGAWVDVIGGTDEIADDTEIFNAHPSWYKDYKILGKMHMLVVANSQGHVPDVAKRRSWYPDAGSVQEQFPRMDLSVSPYWNPKDVWEIRPVYVLDTIPPEFHPYSHKIAVFDAENWRPYLAETFDKKGDFWKHIVFASGAYYSQDGYIDPATGKPPIYMFSAWGVYSDYQRRHATSFNIPPEPQGCVINNPTMTPDHYSLAVLEAAGR
jgi:hypothetical protein